MMIRFATGTALLFVFLVMPASAQITLTEDDIVPEFGSISSAVFDAVNPAGLGAIANATGGNQTYDFTGLTYSDGDTSVVDVVPLSSDIPGAADPALANADFVTFEDPAKNPGLNGTTYLFYSVDNGASFFHGSASVADLDNDGNDETTLFKNDPPLQSLAIPLTFGTTWTSSTTETGSALGIEISVDIVTTAEVDGWGTLITPSGQADCLRILTTTTSTALGISTSVQALLFITREGLSVSVGLDPVTDTPSIVRYSVSSQGDDGGGDGGGDPTAIETLDATIPHAFELHPNYPNPFNPDTVIPFGLSEAGHVTLSVFDALGREVTTLVNETLPAGSYTTDFRAERLPSGVYFYKLQVNGTLLSRTMILQK